MVDTIVAQLDKCLSDNKNFVLSGGAGSGKTHALKDIINLIYKKNPNTRIACITYTEVAAKKITERCFTIERQNKLWVSTIHSFLWENIKNYQKQLKGAIATLIQSNEISWVPKTEENDIKVLIADKQIDYKNYRDLDNGIVWHDDILKISKYLFETYPLLIKIFCDRYDYIFIDEYQDTAEDVINIFMKIINANYHTKVGFFGDSMQSIYSNGIGNLSKYIDNIHLIEIQKPDNFRCSKSVINLCNKIRTDGLKQEPAHRDSTGKIDNKVGKVVFVYSDNPIEYFENHELYYELFRQSGPDKSLYLTHRLIATKAKFKELFEAYETFYNKRGKDRLIGDSKDHMALHLEEISNLIYLYTHNKYNEFIQKTDFKLQNHGSKITLKNNMEQFFSQSFSIGDAIIKMDELRLLKIGDIIRSEKELFDCIKNIPFEQVQNLYNIEHNLTSYSTQHGIKGAEFNDVLVILDNGKWNQYNFTKLFSNTPDPKTLKLFYVCVSRAMNNLVVYMQSPSADTLTKAAEWFGSDNVISI